MVGSGVLIDGVVLHRLLASIGPNPELATMEEVATAHAEARQACSQNGVAPPYVLQFAPGGEFTALPLPALSVLYDFQVVRLRGAGVASSRAGFGTHIPPPRRNFCSRRTNARWTLCLSVLDQQPNRSPSDCRNACERYPEGVCDRAEGGGRPPVARQKAIKR
jgi:hypothetical protein